MERSLATALGVDKQLESSYDKNPKQKAKDALNPVPLASTAGMTASGRYLVSAVAGWVGAHDRCGYAFADVGTIGGKVILSSCPREGTKAFETKVSKLQ